MTGSAEQHQRCAGARIKSVRCAVLTISDSRDAATDKGGPLVERLLVEAGHETVHSAIARDEPRAIVDRLEPWLADPAVQAVVLTGGTGISTRDVTPETIRSLLAVELEGFGELFRMLSWEQVGPAAMLSRALAGIVTRPADAGGDTFLFALPGSLKAVELAITKLVGPQLAHLVWHRQRAQG